MILDRGALNNWTSPGPRLPLL
ncbi:MAG: hypothetical protein H6Q42_3752, partial [Deltaproteobacteria bacterium]|nr:hypothetical protein [Deltaproteobacteria bacterium]